MQTKLAGLEKQSDGENLVLTDKDRQEIEKFRGDMLAVRRELREVKRELRKDIDRLDGVLKFANIAAVPLLIGFAGIGWAAYRRRRTSAAATRSGRLGVAVMTPRNFVYLAIAAALSVLVRRRQLCLQQPVEHGQGGRRQAVSHAGERRQPDRRHRGAPGRQHGRALERTGGSWGLKNRGNYPADPAKVRTLLVGLAEADLVESKTRRPDRYAALELEDPADKGAKSRIVRLLGAKGNVIGEVVIGKKRLDVLGTGKSGTYVRKPGDPQTWLANAELDASAAAKDWLKTSVFTADAAKISRVTIEIPGEQPLRIERPAAPAKDEQGHQAVRSSRSRRRGKLQFAGFPPADKKLKDASAAESIARALASIDMEDVRKLDAPPAGAGVSTVKIETADGPTTTLRLRKDGDAHWLSLAATGEGEAKKAADEINQRTQGWEFKIPASKADSILKKRADLARSAAPGGAEEVTPVTFARRPSRV